MAVIDSIKEGETFFSFELLPPLKGYSIENLYNTVDKLREYNPKCINITNHSSEYIFKEVENNLYRRDSYQRRPCTIAIATAIHNRYGIPVVPHVICESMLMMDTENDLLNLQFLGITDILVLRGDKTDKVSSQPDEHEHAIELQRQVNEFNSGVFCDGSPIKSKINAFHYGVACYPEKHAEAPNLDYDIYWLKKKEEQGAEYAVTQMFFDNAKYFAFVSQARAAGVKMPIIPGVKPLSKKSQLSNLPKTFNIDFPAELMWEVMKSESDDEVREIGIEWCTAQCKELKSHGVPGIHFYTMGQANNIARVAKAVY